VGGFGCCCCHEKRLVDHVGLSVGSYDVPAATTTRAAAAAISKEAAFKEKACAHFATDFSGQSS